MPNEHPQPQAILVIGCTPGEVRTEVLSSSGEFQVIQPGSARPSDVDEASMVFGPIFSELAAEIDEHARAIEAMSRRKPFFGLQTTV